MLTRVRLAASSSAAGLLRRPVGHRFLRPLSTYPPHTLLPMPALSPTMTQGNLAAWKKAEGEEIAAGDVIAEVETDKATVDYEVVDDGIIAKILVPEGAQDIAVGTPLAVVVDDAADVGAFTDFTAPARETRAKHDRHPQQRTVLYDRLLSAGRHAPPPA